MSNVSFSQKDEYTVGDAKVTVLHGVVNRHDASVIVECGDRRLALIIVNQCGTDTIRIVPEK
ncbi:MAG: hypothetical protein AAB517_03050 [Patescibacteria group bacterium]